MASCVQTQKARKKRQQRNHPTKDDTNSVAIDLPDDILMEILAKQPLRSIIRCKQVSKSWNRLISGESFPIPTVSNLPMTHLLCRRQDHRLIRDWHRKSKKIKLVDFSTIYVEQIHNSNYNNQNHPYPTTPLNLHFLPWNKKNRSGLSILDSCNGLLLCSILWKEYMVINPSNETWILLPPAPSLIHLGIHEVWATILAFDPKVSDHFKVVFPYQLHSNVELSIFSSELGAWTSKSISWHVGDIIHVNNPPILRCAQRIVNDIMYLVAGHNIVRLDIQDFTSQIINLPREFESNHGLFDIFKGRLQLFETFGGHKQSHAENIVRIWELEDWLTSNWKLKHTLSLDSLFEGCDRRFYRYYCINPCFHHDRYAFFARVGRNQIIYYELCNSKKLIIALEDFGWERKLLPLSPCWVDLFSIKKGKNQL